MPFISRIVVVGSGPSSGTPCPTCFMQGCAVSERAPCDVCIKGVLGEPDAVRHNPTTLFEVTDTGTDGTVSKKTILVDAGKTMRNSILGYFVPSGLRRVDELLITHPHADAFLGLRDALPLMDPAKPTPLATDAATLAMLVRVFPDLFTDDAGDDSAAATGPRYAGRVIVPGTAFMTSAGIEVLPLHVMHGKDFPCLCYLVSLDVSGRLSEGCAVCVYMSDVGEVPAAVRETIKRFHVRLLVCDLLREKVKGQRDVPSHFGKEDAVEEAQKILPKTSDARCVFIGTSHGIDRVKDAPSFAAAGLPHFSYSHDGAVIYETVSGRNEPGVAGAGAAAAAAAVAAEGGAKL